MSSTAGLGESEINSPVGAPAIAWFYGPRSALPGKFAGLSGTCAYEAKHAPNDGIYIATFAKCKYE